MRSIHIKELILFSLIWLLPNKDGVSQIYIPIKANNREILNGVRLTEIGDFGVLRKARPNVKAHLHTGIDICRPNNNFLDEPIYPIGEGKVISKRVDGPFAQVIIEHNINGKLFWSLYEHISGITVSVDDNVNPNNPIGRFMNRAELDRYGWQFNHVHLEILKVKPLKIQPDSKNPERFYNSYNLVCYTAKELDRYYYNPFRIFDLLRK